MPNNSQNYNRYSYCLNNPLKYTDPDGEWVHLLIGALVGGAMNLMMNAAHIESGWTGVWQGVGYFAVGAVAGALSAGIGAGVSSAIISPGTFASGFVSGTSALNGAVATGFFSGAAIGGSAGLAGGFVHGFGNGLIQNNGNFLESLKQGGIQGGTGLLSGLIIGGLLGGIDASTHTDKLGNKLDFWTGAGTQDVYIGINSNGEARLIDATTHDNKKKVLATTKKMLATKINNNPAVTFKSDGDIVVKLPTGIRVKNMSTTDGMMNQKTMANGRKVQYTPIGDASEIYMDGYRYRYLDISSFSDLFNWR
jgi:hypothetical protein